MFVHTIDALYMQCNSCLVHYVIEKRVNMKFYFKMGQKCNVGCDLNFLLLNHASGITFHDNAWCHTATCVKQFLGYHQITQLSHSPYSPDLWPTNFFPVSKSEIGSGRTQTCKHSDIKAAVNKNLMQWRKVGYSRSFQHLYKCCQKCISSSKEVPRKIVSFFFGNIQYCNISVISYLIYRSHLVN